MSTAFDQTNEEKMNPTLLAVVQFLQRNILLIIGVLALVITVIFTSSTLSARSDVLADQEAQLTQLRGELARTEREVSENYALTVQRGTGGLDMALKRDHDVLFDDLMEDALTWSSIAEYTAAREDVQRKWSIPESSQFMSVFMPGERQGVMREDPQGNMHYSFDSDIRSSYGGAETHVVGMNGSTYSYFAVVKTVHASDSNNATSDGYAVVTYDVNDGEILNLAAMTAPAGVKTSN